MARWVVPDEISNWQRAAWNSRPLAVSAWIRVEHRVIALCESAPGGIIAVARDKKAAWEALEILSGEFATPPFGKGVNEEVVRRGSAENAGCLERVTMDQLRPYAECGEHLR